MMGGGRATGPAASPSHRCARRESDVKGGGVICAPKPNKKQSKQRKSKENNEHTTQQDTEGARTNRMRDVAVQAKGAGRLPVVGQRLPLSAIGLIG